MEMDFKALLVLFLMTLAFFGFLKWGDYRRRKHDREYTEKLAELVRKDGR